MLHAAKAVNGPILWANMHLLFWLSLVPFVTAWMGENHFAMMQVALYGFVLLMAGIAYYILSHCLAVHHGKDSVLYSELGKDRKGIFSVLTYAVGVIVSFFNPWIGLFLYALVAAMWLIPDSRFEKRLAEKGESLPCLRRGGNPLPTPPPEGVREETWL